MAGVLGRRPAGSWAAAAGWVLGGGGRLDLGAAAGWMLGGGGRLDVGRRRRDVGRRRPAGCWAAAARERANESTFWLGRSGGWRKLMGLGFHGALGIHIRKKTDRRKKKLKSFDSKGWTSRD